MGAAAGHHDRQLGHVPITASKHKVDNRTVAYMLALDRVATQMKRRGIYA